MGTERHTEAASTEVARRRPPAQQATSLQPNVATPDLQILSLQRTIGNQAVVGLLRERSKRGSAPGRRDNGPAQLGGAHGFRDRSTSQNRQGAAGCPASFPARGRGRPRR